MAETDADRPAAGAVTTEEADRLSEQFRPSWEEDPPTVKRDPAPRPAANVSAPVPRAPVVSVTAPKPAPPKPAPAAQTVEQGGPKPALPTGGASTAQTAPFALTNKRAPLLGVSTPNAPAGGGAPAARGRGADDLDWEVPASATPSPTQAAVAAPLVATPAASPSGDSAAAPTASATPLRSPADTQPLPVVKQPSPTLNATPPDDAEFDVQVDIEELPPESKPSGIGQKYVPKEEGAPPVVLGDDVRAAEVGARVELEAEHRRRRAPTVLKMKALEVPITAPAESTPDFAMPRRKGGGLIALLAAVTVLGGGAAAAFLVRGGSLDKPATVAPAPTTPPPPAELAPPPATDAPVPPPIPPPEQAASAAPSEAPTEPSGTPERNAGKAPAALEGSAKQAASPAKPIVRPTAKPPKPATASPGPTSKPASRPVSGAKAAIVRDSPF
jgi:hypothetical protein